MTAGLTCLNIPTVRHTLHCYRHGVRIRCQVSGARLTNQQRCRVSRGVEIGLELTPAWTSEPSQILAQHCESIRAQTDVFDKGNEDYPETTF